MLWDIINIPNQPKCDLCGDTTKMMARFNASIRPNYPIYICSSCARFVKEAMNKWTELKSSDWIEPDNIDIFKTGMVDSLIKENKEKASLFPDVDPDDEMKSSMPAEYDWRDNYYKGKKP